MVIKSKEEIPNGWTKTTFGDVLELKYGKSLPAKKRDNIGYPVYGSNGIIGYNSKALTEGPALIVGRKGSIGETHIATDKCWPIDTTYYIDNFNNQPIVYWLHFLKSLNLSNLNRATALPGLNRNDIYDSRIYLPPLNEQKRIVKKIEDLQSHSRRAREELGAVPDFLEKLRQSILASAFRGDLTKEWREKNAKKLEPATELLKRIRIDRRKRWEDLEYKKLKDKGLKGDKLKTEFEKVKKKYKEPAQIITKRLPELPDGWCWANLGELSDYLQYGSSSKSSSEGEIPVLRMGNMQNGEIDWANLVYTSDKNEIEKYKLSPNTVLFNRTNSPELVGKTALYRGQREAIFAGYLIKVNHVPQISASYLNIVMNSPFIKAQKLSQFPIPLCSENEQNLIVSKVEPILFEIMRKHEDIKEWLKLLDGMDQSILSKAFSGHLVPQDENDEPASFLLDKIRLEKSL